MFSLYENCLFCAAHLPEPHQRSGEGEHVIPKNIYGFWKSHDVCEDCKEYFGRDIDNLSLRNGELVKAIQELRLPNADTVFDDLSYQAKDTIDGSPVKMVRKKGAYKIKVSQIGDHFFECAEVDWPKIGLDWIRNTVPAFLSPETVEREINSLREKYDKLQPGETVHSEKLGITIKKKQTQYIQFDPKSFLPISPLIAKIAVCFLYYSLPLQEIGKVKELEMLRSHARHGESIKSHVINWFPPRRKVAYERWHRITLDLCGTVLIVDITLFGSPNWRVILTANEKLSLKVENNQLVERLYFILDFRNFDTREKILAFKYRGKKEIEQYTLHI